MIKRIMIVVCLLILGPMSFAGSSVSPEANIDINSSLNQDTPAALQENQSPIPFKREASKSSPGFGKIVFVFLFIVLLGVLAAIVLKKNFAFNGILPAKSGEHIELLDKQVLDRQTSVYYLDIADKKYVVLVANGHSEIKEVV